MLGHPFVLEDIVESYGLVVIPIGGGGGFLFLWDRRGRDAEVLNVGKVDGALVGVLVGLGRWFGFGLFESSDFFGILLFFTLTRLASLHCSCLGGFEGLFGDR